MKKIFFILMILTGYCYADSHTSLGVITTMTTSQIKNFIPFDTGIVVLNSDDWDIYVSTGTTNNSWKNAKTGNGL